MSNTEEQDPRRNRPLRVSWTGGMASKGAIGHITIDGQLWAAVEWSEKRQAWCIEDCEGRCLAHEASIRGQAASKKEALALAKAMIADGRMPSPEAAQAQYKAAAAERKAQRDKQPSEIRRRQEQQERRKRERELWNERSDADWRERQAQPLYEALADAFDFSDPDLWRSNSFASLRPRLVVWMRSVVSALECDVERQRRPPSGWGRRGPVSDAVKAYRNRELEQAEAKLARAREILGWLKDEQQVRPEAAE